MKVFYAALQMALGIFCIILLMFVTGITAGRGMVAVLAGNEYEALIFIPVSLFSLFVLCFAYAYGRLKSDKSCKIRGES